MKARTPVPPGERVYQELRSRMGEWGPGDKLPSTTELAGQYQVARQTIARVYRRLADEKFVEVVPRWGTFRL